MKSIKTYTSIWNVDKVLYAIYDVPLPFPMTYSQIAWLVSTFILSIVLSNVFPFSLIENVLLKNIALPIGITWLASQKTFDDKKPQNYLLSFVKFHLRGRTTARNKAVKLKNYMLNESITIVRRLNDDDSY